MTDYRKDDHVVVRKDSKGGWYWTRYSTNHKALSGSTESYENKGHALEQAYSLNPGVEVRVEE